MLLRLRDEAGTITVLAVLQGSVLTQHYQALAVALRAAAGRDITICETRKIL
jgi:hypothetical protein